MSWMGKCKPLHIFANTFPVKRTFLFSLPAGLLDLHPLIACDGNLRHLSRKHEFVSLPLNYLVYLLLRYISM